MLVCFNLLAFEHEFYLSYNYFIASFPLSNDFFRGGSGLLGARRFSLASVYVFVCFHHFLPSGLSYGYVEVCLQPQKLFSCASSVVSRPVGTAVTRGVPICHLPVAHTPG